jgi:hypothetical protein
MAENFLGAFAALIKLLASSHLPTIDAIGAGPAPIPGSIVISPRNYAIMGRRKSGQRCQPGFESCWLTCDARSDAGRVLQVPSSGRCIGIAIKPLTTKKIAVSDVQVSGWPRRECQVGHTGSGSCRPPAESPFGRRHALLRARVLYSLGVSANDAQQSRRVGNVCGVGADVIVRCRCCWGVTQSRGNLCCGITAITASPLLPGQAGSSVCPEAGLTDG